MTVRSNMSKQARNNFTTFLIAFSLHRLNLRNILVFFATLTSPTFGFQTREAYYNFFGNCAFAHKHQVTNNHQSTMAPTTKAPIAN